MLNLLVMIAFLVRSKNILFGQICSKNSKLSFSDETWWVDQVEYAELNSDTHFILFWAENNFFGQICFKNIKIFYLRWKLVRNPFEYAEFGGYVYLSCFGLMISFRWNLANEPTEKCWIRWWCSFALLWTDNTLLWANLIKKILKLSV